MQVIISKHHPVDNTATHNVFIQGEFMIAMSSDSFTEYQSFRTTDENVSVRVQSVSSIFPS